MSEYLVGSEINEGGQGTVYHARSLDGSPAAIKYLKLQGSEAEQDEDRKRFRREVTCQSSLDHPGVVKIYGANLNDVQPYFVMPLADGSLRSVLKSSPMGLNEADAVSIFDQVLSAMSYSHAQGVIHRDLKPENILMFAGVPAVSDFGLGRNVRSTSTTLTVKNLGWGTPEYSAPEQFVDLHGVDASADVFALGRIYYEMLTGRMAHSGIDLSLVPAPYRYIIHTATQQDPSKRFASAIEMKRELDLLASGQQAIVSPGSAAAASIQLIANGGGGEVELIRCLLENTDDLELYLKTFVLTPHDVLERLADSHPTEFKLIMHSFDRFAEGSHPFEFTDTLAVFLRAVFSATKDYEIRLLVLERLLILGAEHNRWFVRDAFMDLVQLSMKDAAYAPAIAAMLRVSPSRRAFVADPMSRLSLPAVVAAALAS